eukprot:1749246-Pleurochrysis_carterae.AAC.1
MHAVREDTRARDGCEEVKRGLTRLRGTGIDVAHEAAWDTAAAKRICPPPPSSLVELYLALSTL